jgi:hypothetical protein
MSEPTEGRIWCYSCGKSVSSPVPPDTVIRAWVECPECIERTVAPQQELSDRITQYLSAGGLFNPESMEHDKVRELLMDCRKAFDDASKSILCQGCNHAKAILCGSCFDAAVEESRR